jgi:hypothetical protein
MSQGRRTSRLATTVYWLVAAEFTMGAIAKFWPGVGPFGSDYAVKFVDWGYSPWVRFLVGAIELACAVLLVVPDRRARFVGAAGLVFVLVGAVTTHIVNHDPFGESVAAPVHLVVTAVFALANWPSDWRDLLPAGLSSWVPRPATAAGRGSAGA